MEGSLIVGSESPSPAIKSVKQSKPSKAKVPGGNARSSTHETMPLAEVFPIDPPPSLPSQGAESKKSKSKKVTNKTVVTGTTITHPSSGSTSLPPVTIPSGGRLSVDRYGSVSPAFPSAKPSESDLSSVGGGGPQEPIVVKKAKPIIRAMLDHASGVWFRMPVDPIKDGAPTYLDEISNPMDLSTMMKKLESGVYRYQSELMHDFDLMVTNSIKFNGPQSHVAMDAKALESVWWTEWEKASRLTTKDKRALGGILQKLAQVPG